MILGVIGGIFAPVRSASSGTIRSPDAQLLGTPDDSGLFPKAATPPVKVTFDDALTTLAGSERPEIITAWMFVAIGALGGLQSGRLGVMLCGLLVQE
jgi:hypothetical protein